MLSEMSQPPNLYVYAYRGIVVVCHDQFGNTGSVCVYGYTVEPPNNGHIGDGSLVLCREVVPISEVVPERVWLREISH